MEWKDIEGYEGKYQISNEGKVRSLYDNKGNKRILIRKSIIGKNEYYYINLYKNSKSKTKRIHRLVAETFIPNTNNYNCVNHIDGNKLNNNVDNLEWCTASENMKHAYINGLSNPTANLPKDVKGKNNPKARKVRCVENNKIYTTLKEAEKKLQISHITDCCRKIRNTAGGYHWEYVDDING